LDLTPIDGKRKRKQLNSATSNNHMMRIMKMHKHNIKNIKIIIMMIIKISIDWVDV